MKLLPRLISLTIVALFAVTVTAHDHDYLYRFQDPDEPEEDRITDLISQLTLEEKLGVIWFAPGVERLGIKWTRISEGYHGVAQGGPSNWGKRNPTPTTQFPQAYGLAATWDPELIKQVAANQAEEVRYLYQSPKYDRSGLVVMAPNADIARDPRWGRTEEVYGEDPFLVGTLAAAFAQGLAGDHPRYLKATSLLKHFLANSNEDGRFQSSSDFDEQLWREYYAKPFEKAIKEGGANSMMLAYNSWNGIPCHVHPMVRDIVMEEWGLNGTICTDGGGLTNLVTEHKAFPDMKEASAAVIKAGVNHFLDRMDGMEPAIEEGLITEAEIDEAIRGRLRLFFRLGLLDPPEMVPYASIGLQDGPEPWDRDETRALVREVTRKSIVLLKNDAQALPLDHEKIESIAVVGPLANTTLLDWYSGTPPYTISPRDGITAFGEGGFFEDSKFSVNWVADMSDTAVEAAAERDVAIVVIGNHPESNAGWEITTSDSDGKEGVDRKSIELDPRQIEFVKKVYASNPNTIVVLVANFPFAMPWVCENAPAIVQITHASQEQGNALADVLFGIENPGGKTVQTWPKSIEHLPPKMDYDIRNGRTYMYSSWEPQYAFGYGLSYTTFEMKELKLSQAEATDGDTIETHLQITNTGERDGDEVVQLYVSFPESLVTRPIKQLRGFQRVHLKAGETKEVTIPVNVDDLKYWDMESDQWTLEKGKVLLRAGNSSRTEDLKLEATLVVK